MTAVEAFDGGIQLRVRLTPSGGADRIDGVGVDAAGAPYIRARVRAAAEAGKANAALEELVAHVLRAPRSAVKIVRGATARVKTLRVARVSLAEAAQRAPILFSGNEGE